MGAVASVASAGTTEYAVGQPLCTLPKKAVSGYARCFADRRVTVKKGTPGARAYQPGAGATAGSADTIGPAGGITPSDLTTAYNFNSLAAAGASQTVALVDAFDDPTIESDLQTFDAQYGLTTCTTANGCFKKVNQSGASSPLPATNTGWAGEIALDVETVHAVCQKCKILLVEANTNSFANLEAGVNEAATLGATEISNSYGGPSAPSSTDLAAYNHPGVVITASTGDDGYYNFDKTVDSFSTSPGMPNFPASSNIVVAVGGTSLYLGQSATRQSETVWNDNGPKDYYQTQIGRPLGATGGGCNGTTTAQRWQTQIVGWYSTGCGNTRLPADISSDADYLTGIDTYDTTGGSGWSTIGGTSFSSPTIAAMYALAGGAHYTSKPALTLYGHAGSSSLYDVTVGGNGWCGGEGAASCGNPNLDFGLGGIDCDYNAAGSALNNGDRACDALPGYDGPTGLGTPNGLGAFSRTGPSATISGPTTVTHGTSHGWSATATDPFPGGSVKSYKWDWGDGTTTTTTTNSASHTYATAASRTIKLTVTDNYGMTGTATYAVTVT